jgi:hypothetical protein
MRKWGNKVSFFKGFLVHMVEANQRSVLGNYVYDWMDTDTISTLLPTTRKDSEGRGA